MPCPRIQSVINLCYFTFKIGSQLSFFPFSIKLPFPRLQRVVLIFYYLGSKLPILCLYNLHFDANHFGWLWLCATLQCWQLPWTSLLLHLCVLRVHHFGGKYKRKREIQTDRQTNRERERETWRNRVTLYYFVNMILIFIILVVCTKEKKREREIIEKDIIERKREREREEE